ncbi:MAG: esterase/lipase family protein [Akkermansiaceae bacterium]
MKQILFIVLCICSFLTSSAAAAVKNNETVVLLHGLARSSNSMKRMEKALSAEGYRVLNIDYPSRKLNVQSLAALVRQEIIDKTKDAEQIHFVTHSMGGIILRHIQQHTPLDNIGRTVMLSPPNQGSEVVDKLGHLKVFQWLNGPAGAQLGTAKDQYLSTLKPFESELAVITGNRSINWILSAMIPGPDDGKVSVKNAQLERLNQADQVANFQIVPVSHPYIMKRKKVIESTALFLKSGKLK